MNKLVLIFCIITVTHSSHLGIGLVGPSAPGVVLQGPGSKTSLVGPDGSHISGVAAGGTVVAPPKPGGVVAAAAVPGYVAVAAPVGVVGLGVHHGGLEGQYVPDYSEHLYDDGSYKGDYYEGHY